MQAAFNVLLVFRADGNGRLRREDDVLDFLATLIERDIGDLLIITEGLVSVELLDFYGLAIGTPLARTLEFLFLRRELLDYFLSRDATRRPRLQQPFLWNRWWYGHEQNRNH